MRASFLWATFGAALVAAGCITVVGGPSVPPEPSATPATQATAAPSPSPVVTPTLSLVPVATPPATPIVTLEPGATPSFDISSILTAEITIFNLSDVDLAVEAAIRDPSPGGDDVPVSAFTLGPSQVTTRSVIGGSEASGPLAYRVQFRYSGGSSADGECTVSVSVGQAFTFVAVNDGLAITLGDKTPASLDEALIATSSLCVPPPAPTATP